MEEQVNAYYTAISNAKTQQEVLDLMPSPQIHFFHLIMSQVIKKLEKEQIDLTDEMIKSKEDGTPNEDLKDYLIELNAKIEICKNQVTNQTEPQIEEPQLNRKIILSSQIKKDIKDIPKEEYNHLLNAFDLLISGKGYGNKEKVRPIGTNNQKLKGTIEYKDYNARLLTLPVSGNAIYVYLAVQKKSDKTKELDSLYVKRCGEARAEVQQLKELLKNPNESNQILKESQDMLEEILSSLTKIDKRTSEPLSDIENEQILNQYQEKSAVKIKVK